MLGLHHIHKRKRIHQKHESYPHPNPVKRAVDILAYVIGIAGPLITIPQALKVWINQDASGLSLISWAGYIVVAVFWIIYGILHKEKPLILTYILWVMVHAAVVAGIIFYG